jgi:hypothetical protein
MACETVSVNYLPNEILLKIFSHFGPEDLCLIIAKVCEKWNFLAKGMILWKMFCYDCDRSSDINRIKQVRCSTLLGFRANQLMSFAQPIVLKVGNFKEEFSIGTPFHSE